MEVDGLVLWMDAAYGHHRIWRIKSVCLGSTTTESLIELESLTEKPGTDTEGMKHRTTWVPEVLLRNHKLYKPIEVLGYSS